MFLREMTNSGLKPFDTENQMQSCLFAQGIFEMQLLDCKWQRRWTQSAATADFMNHLNIPICCLAMKSTSGVNEYRTWMVLRIKLSGMIYRKRVLTTNTLLVCSKNWTDLRFTINWWCLSNITWFISVLGARIRVQLIKLFGNVNDTMSWHLSQVFFFFIHTLILTMYECMIYRHFFFTQSVNWRPLLVIFNRNLMFSVLHKTIKPHPKKVYCLMCWMFIFNQIFGFLDFFFSLVLFPWRFVRGIRKFYLSGISQYAYKFVIAQSLKLWTESLTWNVWFENNFFLKNVILIYFSLTLCRINLKILLETNSELSSEWFPLYPHSETLHKIHNLLHRIQELLFTIKHYIHTYKVCCAKFLNEIVACYAHNVWM